MKCQAEVNDCGHSHHDRCYCNEDQGAGYTYSDEYGDCPFCSGEFEGGTRICADKSNVLRKCPECTDMPSKKTFLKGGENSCPKK